MISPIVPNGCFTIKNTIKNTHRTVKISTVKKARIISLLVGPDNNSSYKGFGFVNTNGHIFVWNKYRDSNIMTWIARFISTKFMNDNANYPGVELLVEKKCIICNRRLTTPESIKAGIGPECAKKELF